MGDSRHRCAASPPHPLTDTPRWSRWRASGRGWGSPGSAGAVVGGSLAIGLALPLAAIRAGGLGALAWTALRRSAGGVHEHGRASHAEKARCAILGAAILLALTLQEAWQFGLLAAAGVALLGLRRGVVSVLVGAGMVGALAALAGAPVPS